MEQIRIGLTVKHNKINLLGQITKIGMFLDITIYEVTYSNGRKIIYNLNEFKQIHMYSKALQVLHGKN